MIHFKITDATGKVLHDETREGNTWCVGRSSSCDLVVADLSISNKHLKVELRAQGLRIEDLESTNGTFLDEVRKGVFETDFRTLKLRIGRLWLEIESEAPTQIMRSTEPSSLAGREGLALALLGKFEALNRHLLVVIALGLLLSTLCIQNKLSPEHVISEIVFAVTGGAFLSAIVAVVEWLFNREWLFRRLFWPALLMFLAAIFTDNLLLLVKYNLGAGDITRTTLSFVEVAYNTACALAIWHLWLRRSARMKRRIVSAAILLIACVSVLTSITGVRSSLGRLKFSYKGETISTVAPVLRTLSSADMDAYRRGLEEDFKALESSDK